jgi:hypothetical protein
VGRLVLTFAATGGRMLDPYVFTNYTPPLPRTQGELVLTAAE